MYRVNLLGKVGYFKSLDEVSNFAIEQFNKNDFDTVLKDLRGSVEDIKKDFLALKVFNSKKKLGKNFIFKSNSGVKVCNYFTNFRYKLRVNGKNSVEEQLMNNEKIPIIVNKIIKIGDTNDINLWDFITISYMTAGGQRLGQFMPIVAKAIYEHYCPENNANLLDISAGFGGRLIGAVSSKYNYNYTGVDPSTEAINSLGEMVNFLNVRNRVRLIHLPFENTDNELKDNYYDLCFTSPPYFKKEIYSDEETQSCNRYDDIESWKNGFLKKSFEIAYKKLKKGKFMLINIADVKIGSVTYPLEKITVNSAKEVGYKYEGFKKMEMARLPGLKRKYKNEKIFIFRKVNG